MTDYTTNFERWWKTYPTHRRREKPKCFEIWKKHKLEDRANEVIAKLAADVSFDPQWQRDNKGRQFIPLSKTYLNGGRYDDDTPKPRRAMPQVRAQEPEEKVESCRYRRSVKRVALRWLYRRTMRGPGYWLDEAKIKTMEGLVCSLAIDAKELHEQGKLTDQFAGLITDELDAMAAR